MQNTVLYKNPFQSFTGTCFYSSSRILEGALHPARYCQNVKAFLHILKKAGVAPAASA
jgi:hypothetical protein